MKKIIIITIYLYCFLFISALQVFGNIYSNSNTELTIKPEACEVTASSGTLSFNIVYSGDKTITWTVSPEAEWIKIKGNNKGINSGYFSITYLENMIKTRIGKIIINIEPDTYDSLTVEIKQYGKKQDPKLEIKPMRLLIPIMEGEQKTESLLISNKGNSDLIWKLEIKRKDTISKNLENNYSFIDSDDPNSGLAYRFKDISDTGKQIAGLKDDNVVGPFSIGFDFDFYLKTFQEFYISSNGLIGFGPLASLNARNNKPIPDHGSPDNFIAWFWDDLNGSDARVYYQNFEDEVIIQFQNYLQYGNNKKITAQVILNSCGNILFQYKSLDDGFKTNSATIGIEDENGKNGIQVSYNNDYIHNEQAVLFSKNNCPWIKIKPEKSGNILPDKSMELKVIIDARNLAKGKYECSLIINSNDKNLPKVEIPVIITVLSFEPKLVVEADNMDIVAMEGDVLTKNIKLHNLGTGDLNWNISIDHFSTNTTKNISKENEEENYYVIDSDQLGGPIYQWIDISNTGNQVSEISDDNYCGPFPIGFDFTYYNKIYTEFFIASNGFIGFGPPNNYQSRSNNQIPYESSPNNILAWCWTDLKVGQGAVFFQNINQSLVIQFLNYSQYNGNGIVNAEVVLNPNGSILFQYKSFENDFNTKKSSVGIENEDGTKGIEMIFNADYLHEHLAILFYNRSSKWLYPDILSGIIKPGESQNISVLVDTQNVEPDVYNANIEINSNDYSQSPYVIPVKLHIKEAPPNLTINPLNCDIEMIVGDINTCTFELGNTGIGILNWKLAEIRDKISKLPANIIQNSSKLSGQDNNGYKWDDSDNENGPLFTWIDISKTGTKITDLSDDNYVGPFPIGFSFNFYGQNYNNFFVASNGYIGFGPPDRYNSRNNSPIPSSSSPNNIIAWCFSDLNPYDGSVYYKNEPRQLIIQFKDYGQYQSKGTIDAEIILNQNGTILINYYRIGNEFLVNKCTIGIENNDGTYGVNVVTNDNYLHDSLAIRFINTKVPWFFVKPVSGALNPNETEQIEITIDSSNLTSDIFQKDLIISNNDKNHNPLVLPVKIKVDPAPPRLVVIPEECKAEVTRGAITNCNLEIQNKGIGFLNWHVSEVPQKIFNKMNDSLSNKNKEYMYEFKTSDEQGGPDFYWIDISKSGSKVSGLSDDNFVGPFDIGFEFEYYGEIYTNFYISSNGYIGFGPEVAYNSRTNDPIPSDNPPNNILAWFWDDLLGDNASVYYKSDSMQLIVQFENYNQYGNQGTIDSQVILKRNSTIFFQYKNIKPEFNTKIASIGIENKDGSSGLQLSYDSEFIHDLLSVRFTSNKKKWFSVYPIYGTLAPEESQNITVTINTKELNETNYSDTLSILSNDTSNSPFHVPVNLKVLEEPKPIIDISPTMFDISLRKGEITPCSFNITNTGDGILKWNLFNTIKHIDNNSKLNKISDQKNYSKIDKSNPKKDPFEYTFIDSDREGGPVFCWFDIAETGKKIVGLCDDNNVGPFPIGFDFKYYGTLYNEFYISSNGYIGFGPPDQYENRMNDPMPSPLAPNNIIAWIWDDLIIRDGSVTYQTIDNSKLIIQFDDYGQYQSNGTVDAQIVLSKNGNILIQYKEFNKNFVKNHASIGIENQNGSYGLQVVFNNDYLHDRLAVHFRENSSSWLTADQISGTVNQNESQLVTLQFDANNLKQNNNYSDLLTILTNDNTNPYLNISLDLYVMPLPEPTIITSPEKCVIEVISGEFANCEFNIENNGEGDLHWNIVNIPNISNIFNITSLSNIIDKYPDHYYDPLPKGKYDNRIGKPVTKHSGGPDNFGYYFTDSNEKNCPVFEWKDISSKGDEILYLQDDNFKGPFKIGFSFPYYGKLYTEFYVSSNGFIGFGPPLKYKERGHKPICSTKEPNNFIAWCWKDLKAQNDSEVYYQPLNNVCIIQFKNYGEYIGSGKINAEIMLHLDGRIDILYQLIDNNFEKRNCTIGIENEDGSDGLLVSFNTEYLESYLSIRFSPFPYCSWIAANPPSGTVKPHNIQPVTIKADASSLSPGSYFCNMIINSNDSKNYQLKYPIELTVLKQEKQTKNNFINFKNNISNTISNYKTINKQSDLLNNNLIFESFKNSNHFIYLFETSRLGIIIDNLNGYIDTSYIKDNKIIVLLYIDQKWHLIDILSCINLNEKGVFSIDISKYPDTEKANKIALFLVPEKYQFKENTIFSKIPMDLYKHSIDHIETFRY